jgi:citrate lyase subunit beta/citryl-CoA lyase
LAEGGFGQREVVIRVNAFGTPWAEADLAAVASAGPDAILVPKVSTAADVRAYDAAIAAAPAHTRLWIMVETCALMPRLDEVAALASSTRLAAFAMGTNDLAKEMRAQLRPGRAPFLPILTQTVCAARAHGLLVFDGVSNEFSDMDVVRAECEQGLEFGFDGKCLIHPDQVEPCNAVFTPSGAEVAWAQAVADAFALPENQGKGAIRVEGKMAELLHLEQARRLLAIAAAIG